MKAFTAGALVLVCSVFPSGAAGVSPWIPPRWEFSLNPSYTFETYDEFYFGSSREDLDFGDVDHNTMLLGLEFAPLDDLALDFATGYVATLSSRAEEDDGWADTTFGARYRLVDERLEDSPAWLPTVTLRLGGIIEGSYSADAIEAPGKGSSGFEGSILAGKEIGESGFRVFGDLGYRYWSDDVPDDFFAGVGVGKTFFQRLETALSFRHVQSLSGDELDGPSSFRAHEFPERKEIRDTLELDLGYREPDGRYYGVRLGTTVAGRNTALKHLLGFSFLLPF
jgi:hypothetical protein